jgi:hypothetical protein
MIDTSLPSAANDTDYADEYDKIDICTVVGLIEFKQH